MANERDDNRDHADSNQSSTSNEEKQYEVGNKGGNSHGKENNPANLANDREKASEAGRKGGQR